MSSTARMDRARLERFNRFWEELLQAVPDARRQAVEEAGEAVQRELNTQIGAAELAKMKPDAILVNTARGGLIDENALLDALEAGRLCGAGIDAFSSEPPKDPRWFTLDNVVLGSHCAASTAGASRNMGRMATANLIHDLGL